MKTRAILTSIWIFCFLAAIILVEGYFLRTDVNGEYLLIPRDREFVYQALAFIYGGHISTILACWFIKPFKLPERRVFYRFMTVLAVVVTVLYNLVLLYLLGQGYLYENESIGDILASVKSIGGILAFLTAPISAYYFGAKPPS